MSTSPCSHRWVVAVFPPGEPKVLPMEIVATDSCTDAERIIREIRAEVPHLKVEAMNTRFSNFEGWLEREELDRAGFDTFTVRCRNEEHGADPHQYSGQCISPVRTHSKGTTE